MGGCGVKEKENLNNPEVSDVLHHFRSEADINIYVMNPLIPAQDHDSNVTCVAMYSMTHTAG